LKQRTLTVNKPWVKSEPEPIILPLSPTRRLSSFHNDVTVMLPVMSRSRSCGVCRVPSDSGDKFCGWCGNSLGFL